MRLTKSTETSEVYEFNYMEFCQKLGIPPGQPYIIRVELPQTTSSTIRVIMRPVKRIEDL